MSPRGRGADCALVVGLRAAGAVWRSGSVLEETGAGTKRLVDEYLVHPNILKTLRSEEAVLIRKHPSPTCATSA